MDKQPTCGSCAYCITEEGEPYYCAIQDLYTLVKTSDKACTDFTIKDCLPDDLSEKLSDVKRDLSEPTQNNTKENENTFVSEIQTNDNMEDKELKLKEILSNHIHENFYIPACGLVVLARIDDDARPLHFQRGSLVSHLYSDGRAYEEGEPILYPSREAYLKYPLDARKAWMDWQEEQKPKRWRAKEENEYWYFDQTYTPHRTSDEYILEDDLRYESGNYFRTKELARQAAEAVSKTLDDFHSKHH